MSQHETKGLKYHCGVHASQEEALSSDRRSHLSLAGSKIDFVTVSRGSILLVKGTCGMVTSQAPAEFNFEDNERIMNRGYVFNRYISLKPDHPIKVESFAEVELSGHTPPSFLDFGLAR